MRFSARVSRLTLLVLLMIISIPVVSGWTLNNWAVTPAGAELAPGTEVTTKYSLHFDSWNTGTTFENDNSLTMYTDLESPQWTVTRVETMEDQPAINEPIPVRQAAQVRVDGWSLSYTSKRFDVIVKMTGKIPQRNQSATLVLLKLQELDSTAKLVPGTLTKKEIKVVVPTIEPTPVPTEVTLDMTPSEIIVVTPEPKITSAPAAPSKKVTYTPGPEPLLIAGLLAGLILFAGRSGRRE